KVFDCGDVDIIHGDIMQSHDNTEEKVRKIASKGVMPVIIGGDHSITAPVGKGLEALGPFHVIQIDAHLDWADHRSGMRYGHGNCMRRRSEEHTSELQSRFDLVCRLLLENEKCN